MIQNYDNSQDETKNLAKCTHLEKFIFIQQ
jgi:hypothetical protein